MKFEKSCGALIFDDDKKKILVIKHKKQGHYSFPKGHVEGNETEVQTAKREIFEETGLVAEIDTSFRYVVTYSPKRGIMKDVVYFFATVISGELKLQEEEVADAKWIEIEKVARTVTFDNDRRLLNAAMEHMNKTAKK